LAFQGYEFFNDTQFEDIMSVEELEELVDHALLEDDHNNDGNFVSNDRRHDRLGRISRIRAISLIYLPLIPI
jgi:hypothetical protein